MFCCLNYWTPRPPMVHNNCALSLLLKLNVAKLWKLAQSFCCVVKSSKKRLKRGPPFIFHRRILFLPKKEPKLLIKSYSVHTAMCKSFKAERYQLSQADFEDFSWVCFLVWSLILFSPWIRCKSGKEMAVGLCELNFNIFIETKMIKMTTAIYFLAKKCI